MWKKTTNSKSFDLNKKKVNCIIERTENLLSNFWLTRRILWEKRLQHAWNPSMELGGWGLGKMWHKRKYIYMWNCLKWNGFYFIGFYFHLFASFVIGRECVWERWSRKKKQTHDENIYCRHRKQKEHNHTFFFVWFHFGFVQSLRLFESAILIVLMRFDQWRRGTVLFLFFYFCREKMHDFTRRLNILLLVSAPSKSCGIHFSFALLCVIFEEERARCAMRQNEPNEDALTISSK